MSPPHWPGLARLSRARLGPARGFKPGHAQHYLEWTSPNDSNSALDGQRVLRGRGGVENLQSLLGS
jgi:hypothetical protein